VRGTARTLEKGDVIKAALEKKHGSNTAVEIIVVEGMDDEGAFDEAVKGMQTRIEPHIFHAIANHTKVFPVLSMWLRSYHSIRTQIT
jgi:hypothetical protein